MTRPPKEIDQQTYAGRVAAEIRRRRVKKKLGVDQVAARAGVPEQTWYGWENGRTEPPLRRLPAIAAALGCKPKQLLPDE